jgi:RNA polymerase sigma-70 factor (ECF subfamily)
MAHSVELRLDESSESAYQNAYCYYKDLELGIDKFNERLAAVVEKYVGHDAPADEVTGFIEKLHTNDLYLTVACAQQSEAAWDYFYRKYHKYVLSLAFSFSTSSDAANELAANVMEDLFLRDRLGRTRIASYEGRSSLAAWLHVIVCHRAINDRELKYNHLEQIECMPEIADSASIRSIEAALRATQYETIIKDAIDLACKRLEYRERLMLLLRYDQGLQVSQIARLLGVSTSTISRHLVRSHENLLEYVKKALSFKYRLQQVEIDECLTDLKENPSYSILTFIKQNLE